MGIPSTSCHHFMLTCWIPSRHHQAMGPGRQRHLSYREKSSPPQPFDLVRASQWIRWSLKWFLSHSGTRTPSRFLPRAHNAVTSSSPESRIDWFLQRHDQYVCPQAWRRSMYHRFVQMIKLVYPHDDMRCFFFIFLIVFGLVLISVQWNFLSIRLSCSLWRGSEVV